MSSSYENSTSVNVRSGAIYRIRGLVFTALFGALFIAFSSIQVPVGTVPITLQTLAVMLAGGLLGPVYGFLSIALVVALAATGLPLIHGSGGLSLLLGPTAGFIWMFPIAALFIGIVSDRLFGTGQKLQSSKTILLFVGIVIFGIMLVYIGGVPWLAYKLNLTPAKAMAVGCYPFLPGDTLKAVVAAALIRTLRPLLPRLRP
jgi:biotin transport system substrate-specific component